MKTLDNKKVFVSTPETSKAVQEKAFKLGYKWRTINDVCRTKSPFLYFNSLDNAIIDGYDFNNFQTHRFEEITAAEILAMEVPEPEETFEVFQKVLVRDEDNEEWEPEFFSRKVDSDYPYQIVGGVRCRHCMDYETNKHLAFTTGKP